MTEGATTIDRTLVRTACCLELLCCVQDEKPARDVLGCWERLVGPLDAELRHASDNQRWRALGDKDVASKHARIVAALSSPGAALARLPEMDWSALSFADTSDRDLTPTRVARCSVGWKLPGSSLRPVSISLALPDAPESWARLSDLAAELMTAPAPAWRWLTLGHRFIPPGFQSVALPAALKQIFRLSGRFRGVDVGDPLGFYTWRWAQGLRTVSFVTALSRAYSSAIGARIPSRPRSSVSVRETRECVWLQAGEAPSRIDVNRCDSAEAYANVDALLRDFCARDAINFFAPWDDESSTRWLSRLEAFAGE